MECPICGCEDDFLERCGYMICYNESGLMPNKNDFSECSISGCMDCIDEHEKEHIWNGDVHASSHFPC